MTQQNAPHGTDDYGAMAPTVGPFKNRLYNEGDILALLAENERLRQLAHDLALALRFHREANPYLLNGLDALQRYDRDLP